MKKNEAQMRQQTLSLWMPLRQQTCSSISCLADSMELFTNSSQKGLLICTSDLQVHFYKLNLQVRYKSIYK
jgi:hypothetical protein